MDTNYDHSDLTLHGKFTDDGEYFRLFVLLNGVPIWVLQTDVASQREAFDEAKRAGEQQPDPQQADQSQASSPATESQPSQSAA